MWEDSKGLYLTPHLPKAKGDNSVSKEVHERATGISEIAPKKMRF